LWMWRIFFNMIELDYVYDPELINQRLSVFKDGLAMSFYGEEIVEFLKGLDSALSQMEQQNPDGL
jgi:hypothetical protein